MRHQNKAATWAVTNCWMKSSQPCLSCWLFAAPHFFSLEVSNFCSKQRQTQNKEKSSSFKKNACYQTSPINTRAVLSNIKPVGQTQHPEAIYPPPIIIGFSHILQIWTRFTDFPFLSFVANEFQCEIKVLVSGQSFTVIWPLLPYNTYKIREIWSTNRNLFTTILPSMMLHCLLQKEYQPFTFYNEKLLNK